MQAKAAVALLGLLMLAAGAVRCQQGGGLIHDSCLVLDGPHML
jgi:hypothetical protein